MHLTLGRALVLSALVLAAAATAFDCRRGLIPNWLTLSLLPLAPLLHAYGLRGTHGPYGLSGPAFGALTSLAGALLCALVPYAMFRASWMGGADVKLLATVGALLTPHYGLEVELFALVLAAVFVPARLAFDGRLLRVVWSMAKAAGRAPIEATRERRLPALPDGALDTLRFSPFVLAATVGGRPPVAVRPEDRAVSLRGTSPGDARGAAYVEFLIAILPMLILFWGIMQLNGLLLADLVVRHAAVHAVRAAIVCDSEVTSAGGLRPSSSSSSRGAARGRPPTSRWRR